MRLMGLLWALLDGNSLLLLEEPEISLNDAIVKEIPLILQRVQRDRKARRQIIVSTHSEALLSNPGIDGRSVVLLESSPEGTKARTLHLDEKAALQAGSLSPKWCCQRLGRLRSISLGCGNDLDSLGDRRRFKRVARAPVFDRA